MNKPTKTKAGLTLRMTETKPELFGPSIGPEPQKLNQKRLGELNSEREVFETFLVSMKSQLQLDGAKLFRPNGHDWVEVFSTQAGTDEVARSFEPNLPLGEFNQCLEAIRLKGMIQASTSGKDDNQPSGKFVEPAFYAEPIFAGGERIGVIQLTRRINTTLCQRERELVHDSIVELDMVLGKFSINSLRSPNSTYAKQLEELNLVAQQLAVTHSESEVFEIVATAVQERLGGDRVSYVVPNFDSGMCIVNAMRGNNAIPKKAQFPLKGSAIEEVVNRKEVCWFELHESSDRPDVKKLASQGLRVGICVPIRVGGRIDGVLNVAAKRFGRPVETRNLFAALGRFLESALQRIRAQKKAESTLEKMVHEATHDELTGLLNRSCFAKTLDREISSCKRSGESFAMLFIDLDDFKKVNDSLSHRTGDQLLQLVAERMCSEVRPCDVVARLGGDEFGVLMRGVTTRAEAKPLAERLLNVIRQPYQIGSMDVTVGGSIGLSMCPDDGDSVADLMMHSDIAMYSAKRKGRNNCQTFTREMASEIQERLSLQFDLEKALADKELFLEYQPQLSVCSNEVMGVEALARWNHHRRGQVSPSLFIQHAEDAGLVSQITDLALEHALKAIAELRKLNDRLYVSVNISAADFADSAKLVRRIEKALTKSNLPGDALELELTERVFLEYTHDAQEAIATWKKDGIRLAIDDFGTGFSSLTYLLNLEIDTLKIDQSFVRSIQSNPRQRGIVETILKMGATLNAKCVAEGVESNDELACLQELGCEIYQGHLGFHPMAIEECVKLVASASG
jgi:diguanylate cyclase (GGDEF)-like protein